MKKVQSVSMSNMPVDARVRKVLRAHGLKVTPTRLAVLRALHTSTRPLSAMDLCASAGVGNQSTVYRTVHEGVLIGLVREVPVRHAHAHYELTFDGEEHHHLICTSCGIVEEYISPLCGTVERDALKQSNMFASISNHSFELYGVCKGCESSGKE